MLPNTNSSVKQKNQRGKRKLAFAIILVIAVVAGGALFIGHQRLHSRQVAIRIPSKGPVIKKSASSPDKVTNTTGSDTPQSDKSAQPAVPATTLTAPTGTFVSNHRPSLSGSPLLRQEKSVCNTTPGATCYMLFMKDGVAKQLATQTADNTGSTYWLWDVSQAGFTQGSWQITAVATLNGQTATANDSLPLEVQP